MSYYSFILVFIIGLCLGSFLNVLIHRLPKGEKVFLDRSKCPHCGTYLKWYHNIPLLSFILLRGRCAFCHQKISLIYPAVELLTATLLLLVYLKFYYHLTTFIFLAIYLLFGITISFIDLKTKEIPDILSLPLFFLGILFSSLGHNPKVPGFELSFISGLAGIGLLFLINEVYYLLTKRDGIGMGDLKLMAGIGSYFSYYSFYYVLLYGSIIGVVSYFIHRSFQKMMKKEKVEEAEEFLKTEIPFGPFLFIGSLLYLFFH
jgi:leader peptidase (prepilin peptidase)/N-methyltransferase